MQRNFTIVGSGRQGVAIAYALAAWGSAAQVLLVDHERGRAEAAARRLAGLLPDTRCRFLARDCDVTDRSALADVLTGTAALISAVPYPLNEALTDAAIAAGAHFCDLGGNTAVVRAQLQRDAAARAAGVSVIPDCGLAPGFANLLAAHGVRSLPGARHVHIRCGGLPERPVGPLGYKLLFSFGGLINEYSGMADVLRGGRLAQVPTLEEWERIEFPAPLGVCEAAVTSGGTSTCPETFLGTLETYEYKTVRYPSHFALIRTLRDLGYFEDAITGPDGRTYHPRATTAALFESRMAYPDVRDLVVLRVVVQNADARAHLRYDVLDRHDPRTGFTAMERTTGFPTALVAHLQAQGLAAPGAQPGERALPLDRYAAQLGTFGIDVRVSRGAGPGLREAEAGS